MDIEEKKQILCDVLRLPESARQSTQHKWKSECERIIVVELVRKLNLFVSYRNRFTMVTSTLLDEYGIDNVAAIIIRNDNPNLGKVLAEFGETIEMFSHKPSL